jgi:beta-glucanase (GH16 family)
MMAQSVVRLSVLVGLLASSFGALSEGGPDVQPSVDVVPAGWIMGESYSDEFGGVALDERRWQIDVPSWGAWSWNRDLVEVRAGRLWLGMAFRPHSRDGKQLYYQGGIVRSKSPPLLYGYVEARIKAAARWPGVATAFWMFRNTPEYWTEIDIVEMMQRRLSKRTLDFSQYVMRGTKAQALPVRIKREAKVAWDPSEGFHKYAVLWTEAGISYFADGVLLSQEANEYWHEPMDLVLSVALRKPLDLLADSDGFPTWAEVDYVRVWMPQPGEAGGASQD